MVVPAVVRLIAVPMVSHDRGRGVVDELAADETISSEDRWRG
ncbi:MAG TPA: hypothetical protein VEL79_08970 [Vicinamibacterales bacterium]|nr:hypothetical protein [Vicinamibacterales bacterium]